MFDDVTAQRLERIERETNRRLWDSVVLTASQRNQFEQEVGSSLPGGTANERPLVELLDDRFDRLERKNERLEWQITRLEQRAMQWRRAFLTTLVGTVGAAAMAFAAGLLLAADLLTWSGTALRLHAPPVVAAGMAAPQRAPHQP